MPQYPPVNPTPLQIALHAVDEGSSGDWQTVAIILADEYRKSQRENAGSEIKWERYRRKGVTEMRPYNLEILPSCVSVSEVDRANGSPKKGDMIARNPMNHLDQWLVAKDYFEENFQKVE
jgi:hypothetical protein